MSIVNGQNIIDLAEKIELSHQVSITQVKSQSGKRAAQRRGPLLYNLSLKVGNAKINSDRYYSIMEEISSLNYGTNTLRFKLNKSTSSGNSLTYPRGLWTGTPTVAGANQTGQGVNIATTIVSASGYVKSLDYVQFSNSTKVHQIAPTVGAITAGSVSDNTTHSYDTDSSGNITIKLNTPLARSPADGSPIYFGENVVFHMMMRSKPSVTYLPGDIVEFGEFSFEEVIEDL
jgi:hypothetical protein